MHFALFHDELSVHWLIKSCFKEEEQFYMLILSTSQSEKKVQIRPWKFSDSEYIMDHTQPIDQHKTIFISHHQSYVIYVTMSSSNHVVLSLDHLKLVHSS